MTLHRLKNRPPASGCAVFSLLFCLSAWADVPTPPVTPPVPPGYCSTIYGELSADLAAFNILLQTPPTWQPVAGGPPVFAANLQVADANTGPGLSGPNYLATVQTQLLEEKALGVQAVMVQVGFPVLYAPFFGGQTGLQPYLTLYTQIAQAVRAAGLKLIVENNVLLSNDIESGWTNLNSFYAGLDWNQYMAARATMAATVAQAMQPDYLVLGEEPDGEASQTGQPNVNNPADAAQMIAGEIAAVQALNLPNIKLGAGFGTWLSATGSSSLTAYLTAYVALPLDYIDFHLYPINTEQEASFIDNTLIVASMAAAAGKPIAMSEGWVWKMENAEWDVLNGQNYRGRDPFAFWAPLDAAYLQTVQSLANYTNMLYVAPEGPDYLFTYQTYGGTVANGGAANCTCTTESCSSYEVVHTETELANTANSLADYSVTGFNYSSQLVLTPDTIPPSVPAGLTASPAFVQANLSWSASSDNVGVAGYNLYRCTPPALGQNCTGVYLGQTTSTQYIDSGLTSNTLYTYQVQSFDLANNDSALSPPVTVQTLRTSANSPVGLTATAVSAQEIDLSWSPPQDTTGLSSYLIFSGTSPSNLNQIQTVAKSTTTYKNRALAPATAYYYGVEAVESGIDSPMSPVAWATTLPLPNPPNNVAAVPSVTSIVLTWQEDLAHGGLPVDSYQVYEGPTPVQMTKVATVTAATYTARSLTPATLYYFAVVAVDSANDDSVLSNQSAVSTLPLPPPPTNLAASTPAATQIALTWQWEPLPDGLPIARYLILCGTSPSNLAQVGVITGPAFTWRAAAPATRYYCAVEAVDSGNNDSQPSSQIAVTTPPMPAAPAGVTATANSATNVTVTWTETIPKNGLPIQSYSIFRGTSPTGLSNVATRTTASYTDTSVSAGITYYYAIEATDTGRDVSPMSPTARVTTP